MTAWTPGELAVLTDSGSLNLSVGDDGQPGVEIGMVVVGGQARSATIRIIPAPSPDQLKIISIKPTGRAG